MVYPLIPIFLTTVIGANVVSIGIIEGIAESTASILKAVSGYYSDKIKKRKSFILMGYLLSAVAKPIIGFSSSVFHVLGARFFDKVGKGIRTSPRDALISISTPPEDLGKSFGFHRAMDTIGAILGPVLAFFLLPILANNLRSLFFLSSILGLAAIFLIILFVKEQTPVTITNVKSSQPFKFSMAIFDRRFKLFLLSTFIFSLGTFSPAFLFLKVQEVGLSIALIPIIYAVSNVFYAFFSTPAGIIADRVGHKNVLITAYLIFILVFVGFAVSDKPYLIWLLFIFWGIYNALTDGIIRALTSTLSPEIYRGTALGFLNLAVGLAVLPSSIIAGTLWQNFGSTTAFFAGALFALFGLITLIIAFKIKVIENTQPQTLLDFRP